MSVGVEYLFGEMKFLSIDFRMRGVRRFPRPEERRKPWVRRSLCVEISELLNSGKRFSEVADIYGVRTSTIRSWFKRNCR
ncbi:MAG: hypothetical protein QXM12_03175 [Nitrososphaerota archaeon]